LERPFCGKEDVFNPHFLSLMYCEIHTMSFVYFLDVKAAGLLTAGPFSLFYDSVVKSALGAGL
jgi:hypothetical protein